MRARASLPFAVLALILTACAQGSEIDEAALVTTAHGRTGAGGQGAGGQPSTNPSGGDGTGGTGTGGTAATCDFTEPGPCSVAQEIQSIDGDQHNDVRTETGRTSAWFDVEVIEAVSSIISYPQLSYTATLTSPPGTSYGLFVYTGDGSSPNCAAPPVQATGDPPSFTATWGDTPAVDDSRWISLEVRYLSGGACGPSDLWTLTVEGHTNP